MADVQLVVTDQQNSELNLAVPGVQGATGPTGTVSAAGDGTAAAPGIAFASDTNTGLYSPGADQVAISTNGTGRLFVDANGNITAGSEQTGLSGMSVRNSSASDIRSLGVTGTNYLTNFDAAYLTYNGPSAAGTTFGLSNAGLASLIFQNTSAGAIGTNGASPVVFATTNTERMRITSDGRLGLGTSGPWSLASVAGSGTAGDVTSARQISAGTSSTYNLSLGYYQTGSAQPFAGVIQALDGGTGTRLLLNPSGGSVGIGTTSPTEALQVAGNVIIKAASQSTLTIGSASETGPHYVNVGGGGSSLDFGYQLSGTARLYSNTSNTNQTNIASNNDAIVFMQSAGGTERLRIDSSGRLLVGTSTVFDVPTGDGGIRSPGLQRAATTFADSTISSTFFNTVSGGGGTLSLSRSNTTTLGAQAIALNNDVIGAVYFSASDGTQQIRAAQIFAAVDGTPGTNDMPGRLVFSTTADGASSPTERLRITSDGAVKIAGDNFQIATSKTPASATATGTTGQIAWDASYIYVCTATNTWKRAALSTW
jgi:hypothetical protein